MLCVLCNVCIAMPNAAFCLGCWQDSQEIELKLKSSGHVKQPTPSYEDDLKLAQQLAEDEEKSFHDESKLVLPEGFSRCPVCQVPFEPVINCTIFRCAFPAPYSNLSKDSIAHASLDQLLHWRKTGQILSIGCLAPFKLTKIGGTPVVLRKANGDFDYST